jgi:uncharacterized membrane protein YbhN (UPF0104 family)
MAPLSRLLRLLTAVLGLAAGLWVMWTLAGDGEAVRRLATGQLLGWLALGALAYAALTVVLAAAWWWLCRLYAQQPRLLTAYTIWARSQIAKYLPGNVFHYVGRQLLGRRAGLSHATLVGSAILETVSLILAATLLALHRAASGEWGSALLPAGFALVFLACFPAAERWIRRRLARESDSSLPAPGALRLSRFLGPTVLLHLSFLLGTGGILLGLLMAGGNHPDVDPRRVITAYAVAWLAGTLMPGAPAGMGVREMVLTLELEPVLGPAHAAALALALRLVTTAGDLITALLGHLLPLAKNPTSPPALPGTGAP